MAAILLWPCVIGSLGHALFEDINDDVIAFASKSTATVILGKRPPQFLVPRDMMSWLSHFPSLPNLSLSFPTLLTPQQQYQFAATAE
ncbi:unnamed protein product [Camellia sinensis]